MSAAHPYFPGGPDGGYSEDWSGSDMDMSDEEDSRSYPTDTLYGGHKVPRTIAGLKGGIKIHDNDPLPMQMSNTPVLIHISDIPRGSSSSTRMGKAFRVLSCHIRAHITVSATTVVAFGGFALFWDYHPNKALAVIGDVYQNFALFDFNTFQNWEMMGRIRILYEYRKAFSGAPGVNDAGAAVLDELVHLPNDCVALCTSADSFGNIIFRINGALCMVAFGNVGIADAPSMTVATRLVYEDI